MCTEGENKDKDSACRASGLESGGRWWIQDEIDGESVVWRQTGGYVRIRIQCELGAGERPAIRACVRAAFVYRALSGTGIESRGGGGRAGREDEEGSEAVRLRPRGRRRREPRSWGRLGECRQRIGRVARSDAVRVEGCGELPPDLLVVEVLRGGPKQKLGLVEVEPAALREGEVPRERRVRGNGFGLEREREDKVRAVEAVREHDAMPGGVEVRVVALDEL